MAAGDFECRVLGTGNSSCVMQSHKNLGKNGRKRYSGTGRDWLEFDLNSNGSQAWKYEKLLKNKLGLDNARQAAAATDRERERETGQSRVRERSEEVALETGYAARPRNWLHSRQTNKGNEQSTNANNCTQHKIIIKAVKRARERERAKCKRLNNTQRTQRRTWKTAWKPEFKQSSQLSQVPNGTRCVCLLFKR